MRPYTLAAALLLIAAAPSLAADDVLQLKTGQLAIGEIIAVDETGVTLKKDGKEAKYDWDSLTPITQYEVRLGRLAPSDAKGYVDLARFCFENGLYTRARRLVATARGVGHPNAKGLDELRKIIDEAEAQNTFARVEQLVAEEEYQKAIEEIRQFLIDAPQSDHTRKARAMALDLLRKKDAQELREEEEREAAQDEKRREEIAARLKKLLEDVEAARKTASDAYSEAVRYHQLGNVTRSRKGYQKAEEHLLKAHRDLRRVQRLARSGVTFEKAEKDKGAIRKKLVGIYLGLARLYLDDRNYKRGVPYLNKVLFLDPVNKEALDLRKKVDKDRIRRTLRGLTNAAPIGSGR